jgi:hypothetical protein
MDLSDGFLIGLSSLVITVAGYIICAVNYRRICPIKKEELAVVEVTTWK